MTTRPWGSWHTLYIDAKLELRLLDIKAGGFCSTHTHKGKFNSFEVIEGRLFVTIMRLIHGGNLVPCQVHELRPRDRSFSTVPGEIHLFHTDRPTLVYETMRAAEGVVYDPEDTVTYREAGCKEQNDGK